MPGSFGDHGTGIDGIKVGRSQPRSAWDRNLGRWDLVGIDLGSDGIENAAEAWDQNRGRNSLFLSFPFPFFTLTGNVLNITYTTLLTVYLGYISMLTSDPNFLGSGNIMKSVGIETGI